MTTDDLDYKIYNVCKSIACANIEKERVYWNSEELFKRIDKKGLEDARALLRIFEKEISDHNSKLKSKIEELAATDKLIKENAALKTQLAEMQKNCLRAACEQVKAGEVHDQGDRASSDPKTVTDEPATIAVEKNDTVITPPSDKK